MSDIDKLTDVANKKFVSLYAKDKRFYTIISSYIAKTLDTGDFARYEPADIEEFAGIVPLAYVHPLGYNRWFFQVDTNRVKVNRAIANQLHESSTATSLMYTDNYKGYNINQKLYSYPKSQFINLTFSTMNFEEFVFLQNFLLPKERRLELALAHKVQKAYRTRPEKILDLFEYLRENRLDKYRDIVRLLGSTDNTQESFLIKLLTIKIKSERSLKTQSRNRYRELEDLATQVGYGRLRGYLAHTLDDIIFVKDSINHNLIYKDIARIKKDKLLVSEEDENEESEVDYDFMAKRLNWYIRDIKQIPYSRMALLAKVLSEQTTFRDSLGTYKFICDYMAELVSYQGL